MRSALLVSLEAGLLATAIALVLGSCAAFAIHRTRFFGREVVSLLFILPLALPGIIATSIFSFIVAWNDYLIARIFINSITQLPLTVGVMHFFEGTHVDWGLMMAAAVLITLPLAVLFMFVQRQLVVGFGAGAVKG